MSIEHPDSADNHRSRTLIAVVAALAVVTLGLLALLLHGDSKKSAAGPTPTPFVFTTPTASPSPSPSPSPTPAPTPPPSTPAPSAPPVVLTHPTNPAGAFMTAPPVQPALFSTQPPTAPCDGLIETGWTKVQCDAFTHPAADGSTSRVTALVEQKGSAYRAYVLTWSQGKGAWLIALSYDSVAAGTNLTSARYVARDVNADGVPELVFGFRNAGTGHILDVDLIDSLFTGAAVRSHRELAHGQTVVTTTAITDMETGATPGDYIFTQITWSGSGWVESVGTHSTAPLASGDFPS